MARKASTPKAGLNKVRDVPGKKGSMACSDLLLKPNSVSWIHPGSTALDKLLGGMPSEFTDSPLGPPSCFSGRLEKTELAHTLCITSQLYMEPHKDIGKIAYIDTEGTFETDKLIKIAEGLGVESAPLIRNIMYARASTYEDVEELLYDLKSQMNKTPVNLMIINSMTALFNTELNNGYSIHGCQIKTLEMMHCITKIVNEFNIIVYITNHVADPEEIRSADATVGRSLKLPRQRWYFMGAKNIQKLKNATQVTTGNSVLRYMHQGAEPKHETVRPNSQKLQESKAKIRISCPDSIFYLEASLDDSIEKLLNIIEKRTSHSRESFYLTYLGRKIYPGRILQQLGARVSVITIELHPRLRGGCPINGISLQELVANNSMGWSTMFHGKKLWSNGLVKEVLVSYPHKKGMQQELKLVMQPLAIRICNGILHNIHLAHNTDRSWNGSISLDTFRMVGGIMEVSQAATEVLDENSAQNDYKQASKLFLDMLELNYKTPIYLKYLCSQMNTVGVTLAKNRTFQLFLRVHPSLMTYSTRSCLLWEIQRELDGLLHSTKATIQHAIDRIKLNRDWRLSAQQQDAMYDTLNKSYRNSPYELLRFIRNWLTHGLENFNLLNSRRFTSEDMDYLLEIVFQDFVAVLFWTLIELNIDKLNRWFEDVRDNNSF